MCKRIQEYEFLTSWELCLKFYGINGTLNIPFWYLQKKYIVLLLLGFQNCFLNERKKIWSCAQICAEGLLSLESVRSLDSDSTVPQKNSWKPIRSIIPQTFPFELCWNWRQSLLICWTEVRLFLLPFSYLDSLVNSPSSTKIKNWSCIP